MDFYKGHVYFSNNKFPMRNKYTTILGNFTNRIKRGYNLINKEFHILLRKNMVEEYLENRKMKHFQMLRHIALTKQKKVESQIKRQKRLKLKAKIRKSVSNNNMLLNIMSQDKQFHTYLESQKKSRNNNHSVKNYSDKRNNSSSLIMNKNKNKNKSRSYLFMTEIPNLNFNNAFIQNKTNLIKSIKNKVFKSSLNIDSRKIKNLNNKIPSIKINSFSTSNILNTKKMLAHTKKRKINIRNIHIWNTNEIKSKFIK